MPELVREKDLLNVLKSKLGYTDSNQTCSTCDFYTGCDMSGSNNALPSHCRKMVVLLIPVDATGHCNEWNMKR